MSIALAPYPVLNNTLFQQIGYVPKDIEALYREDGINELQIEEFTSNPLNFKAKIKDEKCRWHPETHELRINKQCRITSAYYLFGENGIAPDNAKLGVALRWISKSTNERGTVIIGELTNQSSSVDFSGTITFPENTLKDSVVLETVLFLKQAAACLGETVGFAKQNGTVLGLLDRVELIVDGNGSLFPIVVINDPKRPLWEVYYDDTADLYEEKFDVDNVAIYLNQAHKDYPLLEVETNLIETPLLLEVLSNALFLIVMAAKDAAGTEWNDILSGEEGDTGSIASAMYYFYKTLNWDMSSPVELAKSIKLYFENSQQR